MGPVCSSCYRIILDYPKECDRCRSIRPLVARDRNDTPICGPCGGFDDLAYNCARCGRSGELFADRACARCVLADRLHDLLSGPDGQVSQQLQPVLAGFAKTERARGIIFWLNRSPNAALLSRLASTGEELTHELLDELPFNRNLHYVREVLVHTGVLPERNEDLERIPPWLDTLLADRPQRHARLIRPFAHWFLLRRARRRANERRYPAESGRVVRTRIRVALEFLAWLDEHDLELSRLTQDRLNSWLVATGRRGRDIRYFLQWAHGRKMAPKLHIPKITQADPYHFLDEDARWSQLNRCLNDEEMPLDVRCAGALLLLYGLPAVRIRYLRTEQLYHRDGTSYLDLGPRPLILPPKLARLLHRLAESPNTNQARLVAPGSNRWLFPGLVPGRPAGPATFSHKLPEHGIRALPARNAALAALASDIPPPILADILGLHINTAVRWAAVTKRDWTDYLTARAEGLRRGNTAPSQ
jgi:hypothetical protein